MPYFLQCLGDIPFVIQTYCLIAQMGWYHAPEAVMGLNHVGASPNWPEFSNLLQVYVGLTFTTD